MVTEIFGKKRLVGIDTRRHTSLKVAVKLHLASLTPRSARLLVLQVKKEAKLLQARQPTFCELQLKPQLAKL